MPDNIYFLRHGKLDLPYKDHAEMPFDVFADLGSGHLNPPIDDVFADTIMQKFRESGELAQTTHIISSPIRRCIDTAHLFVEEFGNQTDEITIEPALTEVQFDLRALNIEGGIEKALALHDITTANEIVFSGMLSGAGCEPVESIYTRVGRVFESVRTREGNIVLFTHDFIMRVIEIYIKRHAAPYTEITMQDLLATKRNTYLDGFKTNQTLDEFRSFPS